jgi:hypothetical protein
MQMPSISRTEILASLAIISSLCFIILWLTTQRDHFKPDERDLSYDEAPLNQVKDPLYKPPLKVWEEPGTGSVGGGAPNLGLFPASVFEGEWRMSSRVQEFGPKNLYEKINGEAEKFLQRGFKSLHYIALRSASDEDEIAIELFDQGDQMGSMDIFSEYVSGEKTLERHGPTVYVMTPAGAIGRSGPFFFRIAGNRNSDLIRKKAIQLVNALSQLHEKGIRESAELGILKSAMNIDPEQITFESVNVFQFDFANDFWFGRLKVDQPTRVFIHRNPTPEGAVILFDRIVTEQESDYQIKVRKGQQALMQHVFLKTWFAIRQRDRLVYGIEEALDENQAVEILNTLEAALPYEKESD